MPTILPLPTLTSRAVLATSAAATLVLGSLLAPPAGSAAGTSLGATFAGSSTCGDFTMLQTSSPGGSSSAPSRGVITSWRSEVGAQAPAALALKVGRASGDGYVVTATSPLVVPAPDSLSGGDVRIAVESGDVIGFYTTGASCYRFLAGYEVVFTSGNRTGPLAGATDGPRVQLDVAATFEPDADGDGYGDVSQDLCPTDRATQASCESSAPQTTITSLRATKAKKAKKKAKVRARFAADEASTFACAVDSRAFKPCASPYVFKAKVGKHSLAVRATDTAGNRDRSAATKRFTVKVASKK